MWLKTYNVIGTEYYFLICFFLVNKYLTIPECDSGSHFESLKLTQNFWFINHKSKEKLKHFM